MTTTEIHLSTQADVNMLMSSWLKEVDVNIGAIEVTNYTDKSLNFDLNELGLSDQISVQAHVFVEQGMVIVGSSASVLEVLTLGSAGIVFSLGPGFDLVIRDLPNLISLDLNGIRSLSALTLENLPKLETVQHLQITMELEGHTRIVATALKSFEFVNLTYPENASNITIMDNPLDEVMIPHVSNITRGLYITNSGVLDYPATNVTLGALETANDIKLGGLLGLSIPVLQSVDNGFSIEGPLSTLELPSFQHVRDQLSVISTCSNLNCTKFAHSFETRGVQLNQNNFTCRSSVQNSTCVFPTASSSITGKTPSPSPSPSTPNSSKNKGTSALSRGNLIGGIVGGCVMLIVFLLILWAVKVRKQWKFSHTGSARRAQTWRAELEQIERSGTRTPLVEAMGDEMARAELEGEAPQQLANAG